MGHARHSKGASLVEMMVALSVLGIVVAGISTFMGNQIRSSNRLGIKRTQMRIADHIQQTMSDPDNIRASIDYGINTALQNCVYQSGTCNATTQSAYANPFNLYRATTDTSGVQGAVKVAGGILYDSKGDVCAVASPSCIFRADTYFWATCDFDNTLTRRPNATCSVSRYLNFRFLISYIAPPDTMGGPVVTDYPKLSDFVNNVTALAIRMRTSDVVQKLQQTCPPNQIVKGVKTDGTPICQCRNGNQLNIALTQNTNSTVVVTNPRANFALSCGPQQCPGLNDIMVGYDNSGNIKCINQSNCGNPASPVYNDCPCFNTSISNSGTGTCGAGYWMVNFQYGVCEGITDKKGTGVTVETVQCEDNEIRCCKLDI